MVFLFFFFFFFFQKYKQDPLQGRSKTFLTGAGLMIFFIVNSIGETFLGIELGHKEDGSTASAAGYAVLDIVLSGMLFLLSFGMKYFLILLVNLTYITLFSYVSPPPLSLNRITTCSNDNKTIMGIQR